MRFLRSDDTHDKLMQACALQAAYDLGGQGCTPGERQSARYFLSDLGLSHDEIARAAMLIYNRRADTRQKRADNRHAKRSSQQ